MHKYKFSVDPVSRIEGHLGIEATVENGSVSEAISSGTLFRGFEIILKGRDPRDANRLSQRVCGVCPTVHAKASALCLDEAFGIAGAIPDNGRIIRNLIQGSNFLQSHILHFYHLAALDYVDATKAVGAVSPFTPRYEGDYRLPEAANTSATRHYVMALDIRRKAHELLAIFGGKMPHNVSIIPGGVTEHPTEDKIAAFLWRLNEIRDFINDFYLPDVIAVAKAYSDYFSIGKGCCNMLSFGAFEQTDGPFFPSGAISADLKPQPFDASLITEHVKHSWYSDTETHKHPAESDTIPDTDKKGAYSYIKAPRYKDAVYEGGPLARMLLGYATGNAAIRSMVDSVLSAAKVKPADLFSVMGRHAARAIECKIVADAMASWVTELKPGHPVLADYRLPVEAHGAGLTDAPRGTLGHWIAVKNSVIDRYQIISPTSWNGSPRDDNGNPGPMEQSLMGTSVKDKKNPFEVVRIVRAFDPCLACSIQLIDGSKKLWGEFEVV